MNFNFRNTKDSQFSQEEQTRNDTTIESGRSPFQANSLFSKVQQTQGTTDLLQSNFLGTKEARPGMVAPLASIENTQGSLLTGANRQAPNYQPLKVIGNGAFGYVFEAFDNNRKCKVALKRTQKAGNIISREFEILDMLRGKENIVQLLDFFYSIDDKQRIIQNTVLEFCDESLEHVLKRLDHEKSFIDMKTLRKYIRQIFNGLKNMHDLGISHRDLKPENILLKDQVVRICDLGSSKVLDKSPASMNTPYVVSRYYRAPELILACHKYDFSIDIWAVGCILFELLLKTPMFPGDTEGIQIVEMQQILGPPSEYELNQFAENLIDKNVSELFQRCTQLEQNQKMNLFDMFRSSPAFMDDPRQYDQEFLREAADLVEKCLKWVPKDRISAEDALDHAFCQL